MKSDKFFSLHEHGLPPVGLNVFRMEFKDGILCNNFLKFKEFLIVFLAAVQEISHLGFVEGAPVPFFLQH